MNLAELIKTFIEKNKEKGVSAEEISEAFFVAFGVVLAKTNQDLENVLSQEQKSELVEKMKGLKGQEEIERFISTKGEMVVGDDGKTFKQLFEDNFGSFIEKLG